MSETGEPPVPPDAGATPPETPKGKPSLWTRYRTSPLWARIAIPVGIVVVLAGIGVAIASAVGGGSSSSPTTTPPHRDALLIAVARQLSGSTTAATTTTTTETTTTTQATTSTSTTTTTVAPTTTSTTTTTTIAPTTTSTTTTTVPPTSSTTTTTTTTEPPPSTEAPPTEAPPTEAPPTEAPPTEAPPTEAPPTTSTTPPTIPLPPGSVAGSASEFQAAWNAAVSNDVPQITSWTQLSIGGDVVNVADLGGNIRVAVASKTPDGPIAEAFLAWLPLADSADQAAQNTMYRNAFNVLIKTVNSAARSAQQSRVSNDLGLTPDNPPFPLGTTANSTLAQQRYDLEAVQPEQASGVDTLIGVTQV